FKTDVGFTQDRQRSLFILLVALDQPQHTDAMKQLPLPAAFVLLPQDESARGHVRIDRARSVGRADDPGLAAGARARISRTPRIDERHARALAAQEQRRPAAV